MLVIVPARGGSKGLPRKNLRTVGGIPLVLRTLLAARAVAEPSWRIICSTDDPTIAAIAKMHGFTVDDRPSELAGDDATVQLVALDLAQRLNWTGMVMVLQPTAANITAATISLCVSEFIGAEIDSLATVVAEHHAIRDQDGSPLTKAVNRQDRLPLWRETGGVQIARCMPARESQALTPLVGEVHHLAELTPDEAVDIDTVDDLHAARHFESRKRIHFLATCTNERGSGHLRRCLALAEELDHHDVQVSLTDGDDVPDWAHDEASRYPAFTDGVQSDLVVLDMLDTPGTLVADLRARGQLVVSLEDLGPGAAMANFVVNELYDNALPNSVTGPAYAVLRPEFLACPDYVVQDEVTKILVTFGGTDPANLEYRVGSIAERVTRVTDVAGRPMVEAMREADLVVTSCGRTVHEAAAAGVPVIAIAANAREARHSLCPGVIYLGLHVTLSDDTIEQTIGRVAQNPELRREMSTTARAAVDGKGARRIAHIIEGMLEGL